MAFVFPVYPDENGFGDNRRLELVVDKAHPGLVNLFVNQVRREYLLTQPLKAKERKPSVRQKLRQPLPDAPGREPPQKARGQER